ncbi:MAG TPA: peptide chain release factor N(5)-glutamine methyltransferase [Chlamydiales bacterium]|nr:peptide chain release factor N(5)-glutamine methyltransferase [Chlamydiales bacterium]
MKNIGEVLQLSTAFLEERGVQRARRLIEELLSFKLQMKRLELYMHFDRPVDEKELAALRDPLKRLAKEEPIEYILGEVEFCGCKLSIDSRVLIPRPETEIFAERILNTIQGPVVWDLCTGSGCLGIALKKRRPELDVTLSDLSSEALALAAQNATENQVKVSLVQGDLLAPFQGQQADVVVCNPPYISASEYLNLEPSVRNFEPMMALVSGERGTEFYERLARDLPLFLKDRAQVFLEIGSGQGLAVQKIFSGGPWIRAEVEKDWAGHDRFFFLEK